MAPLSGIGLRLSVQLMFKQPRTDAATRSDLHGVFCMANQMQGTPNPACKMRLGRGQAGKGVVGRAPDKLVVDGFWGRTGSVPTTPPPPTCVRCLPVMGGAAREVERRDDRRKTSKGPVGVARQRKMGKSLRHVPGFGDGPEQDRFREGPGHIPEILGYLTQLALHCFRGRVT